MPTFRKADVKEILSANKIMFHDNAEKWVQQYNEFTCNISKPVLNDCLEYFKKQRNHALFARLFLSMPSQLFLQKLRERHLPEIDTLYENHLNGPAPLFYKNLSEGNEQYDPQTLYNLMDEKIDSIPKRDFLLQLGIHLGLKTDEINRLLRLSEEGALYPIDYHDVVIKYYLDNRAEGAEANNIIEQIRRELHKIQNTKASAYALDKEISKVVAQYKADLNANFSVDESADKSLTFCVKKSQEKISDNLSELKRTIPEFIKKRYGLISQTEEFISGIDMYKKYFGKNSRKRTGSIRNLYSIYREGTEPFGTKATDRGVAGTRNIVGFVLEGRKGKDGYRSVAPSRTQLIRLAIAAGREDEAGSYLKRAGLWEKDYTVLGTDPQLENGMDSAELLLLYALKIRDFLVENGVKNEQGIDLPGGKSKCKADFDFIGLLTEISKEILFTKFYVVDGFHRENTMSSKKPEEMENYMAELEKLMDKLIFPVKKECDDGWYAFSRQVLSQWIK